MRRVVAALLALQAAMASIPGWAATAAVPDDAALVAAGALVGEIRIRSQNIFNTTDPRENRALFRLANRWHVRTRHSAVRAQLLFHSGEPYSPRLLQESERNLRQVNFIREPRVRPVAWHDGRVDIEVMTRDVWTLQVGPAFSRSGGANNAAFAFEDINLLGYGKTVMAGVRKSVDRSSIELGWTDPALFGTHWRDIIEWAENSDGRARRLDIGRPFYSLDTRTSYALSLADSVGSEYRYRLGSRYDSYRHANSYADLEFGHSTGLIGAHVRRLTLGWRVEHDTFSMAPDTLTLAPIPDNRELNYPYLQAEWLTDRYQTTRNLEQIDRTEDLQFGFNALARVGWASPGFGADRQALIVSAALQNGWQLGAAETLFASIIYDARREAGRVIDARTSGTASWYWRTTERSLMNVKFTGAMGNALDLDHYFELGGDNGLRGYPLRYQTGSARAVLKIEQRYYTSYSLLQLLDVGGAAFVDVGRVWGTNPIDAPPLGWLSDIGFGLRLGNSRSSLGNVIHVDIAAPLNGVSLRRVQFLVGTEASF